MHLRDRIQPSPPVALSLPPEIEAAPRRPRVSRRQRWLIAAIVISLLLHGLAVLVVVWQPPERKLPDSQASAPAEWQVEVQKDAQSAAPPPTTQTESDAPALPPAPTPTPQPVPAPAPKPEPKPEPAPEPQPEPAPAPPPPAPAPPVQPPPPSAAPVETPVAKPMEVTPDGIAPPTPAPPAPPAPAVPPPQETAPPKPAPKPEPAKPAPPKPAQRPQAAPSTAFPRMPLSSDFFAPPSPAQPSPAQPRPPAPSGGVRGPLSTALGPVENIKGEPPTRNPNDENADIQVTGAQVGSDWMRQVHEWWVIHRRYPEEAARNNEQGELVVTFKVARTGQVSGFQILQHSGSQWLDVQTTATFAHAKLPPFPPTTPEDEATLTVHVLYEIYGR